MPNNAHSNNNEPFPFRITQTIINGRRFFEMIAHYQERVEKYVSKDSNERFKENNLDGHPHEQQILCAINTYKGRMRKGDQFVRMIFDCLCLYYIDTFGLAEMPHAIKKIFIWVYGFRLKYKRIQLSYMENYVEWAEINLFTLLKEPLRPSDFLDASLKAVEVRYDIKELKDLF